MGVCMCVCVCISVQFYIYIASYIAPFCVARYQGQINVNSSIKEYLFAIPKICLFVSLDISTLYPLPHVQWILLLW